MIFEEPKLKVLLDRRSSLGRAGEPVLCPSAFRVSLAKRARQTWMRTCLVYPPCMASQWPHCSIHSLTVRPDGHIMRSVHSITDQSGYLQISWRSEIDRPKVLKEARHCQPVRKLLFSFAQASAKCGRNGLSMHIQWGIRVQQTPKVLRVRSSFGRAGEPTIVHKWGGRTNRARNRASWTH